MSLIKSLNSGVSGLKSFQTKMDTIGNNIANVDTTGFKSSRVSFSELMNENIGGNSGGESAPSLSNQVGLGVRVASVDRDFSQGTIENTGKTTDLAIEGDGFFVVNNGNQNLMTRAGNFTFNKNGNLVDQSGNYVQGYNANDSGNILGGGTTENVRIDFENALPPQQTDEVNLAGNLNANTSTTQIVQAQSAFTDSSGNIAAGTTDINDLSQTTSDLEVGDVIEVTYTQNDGTAGATADFEYGTDGTTLDDMVAALNTDLGAQGDLALVDGMLQLKSGSLGDSELNIDSTNVIDNAGDADAVNFPGFQVTQEGETNTQTMSTTVYDDLGKGHSLLIDFTQVAENEWEYEAEFADGETISSGSTGTVTFDEMGQVTSGGNFNMEFEPGNGAGTTNFDVELGDSSQGTTFTQYSGANTAKVVSQDGYSQGSLVDISIDGDGRLQGVYDNGQNKDLAQLALGNVQNEDGLEMVGGGLFRATSAAGEVFIDSADNLSDSSINSGALEGSNVDLAQEFTEMITSQRAYQSSARVISTSDEMLTEAVNLKR
ncbi:flagellar basal-body rod protein FlgF [Aliifodinibius salicampi]|uniref:Flagellar hook protein FlgE n=1 Tax=Fodinibius salicampi TaxID=1920655 RepID=A0ABT3Q0K7_9BACT|nr:flagellar basal-body rod protein FlgF [Fodinibius salicampi]MCW9713615.1 flagellar basal-body rod protein FlgF [Fodinibius salicampi]